MNEEKRGICIQSLWEIKVNRNLGHQPLIGWMQRAKYAPMLFHGIHHHHPTNFTKTYFKLHKFYSKFGQIPYKFYTHCQEIADNRKGV